MKTNTVSMPPREKLLILEHIQELVDNFKKYFGNTSLKFEQLEWVRNPFVACSSDLPLALKEELIEVFNSNQLRMQFKTKSLFQFWACVRICHPKLFDEAEKILLPFPTTYFCETSFSAVATIKTKFRNKLSVENSLRVALSNCEPNYDVLLSKFNK